MRVGKIVRIMAWKVYYWLSGVIRDRKLSEINICEDGLWGVKTIRNDLLAKAFLTKRE